MLSCCSSVFPPVTLTFVGRVGQSEFVSVESSLEEGFLKIPKRKQIILNITSINLSSKKGVFMAVISIEKPMSRRQVIVINLPAEKSHFRNTTRRIDELAKINKQAGDDNGPGAEHVVELEEVEDLHHAQEEGPGQHLVPDQ